MSIVFYNLFLVCYSVGVRIYSFFNTKAGKWIKGRKGQLPKILALANNKEQRVWIHCSSLGEFEQGRPLIEKIKKQYPYYKIVLTFFSPSGYDACKGYEQADYIFYLPMDGRLNARKFIKAIKPSLAVFVKYEFWYYYLSQLHKDGIPTILISGAFRRDQAFFKAYGAFFRKMLSCFNFLFVQDDEAQRLLNKIGLVDNVRIAGDTRYDRVATIASNTRPVKQVENFKGSNSILIAGSTWPGDEEVLKDCLLSLPDNWKMIIAPHEIDKAHIQNIRELLGDKVVLFSEMNDGTAQNKKILLIDNIGMLSSLYVYGDIAFIGGGFQKGGIHNILEPAVFGLPLIFGPVYEKFVEANTLVKLKYAFPVTDTKECRAILDRLISDKQYRHNIHNDLIAFVKQNIGAADSIMEQINKERWLIN